MLNPSSSVLPMCGAQQTTSECNWRLGIPNGVNLRWSPQWRTNLHITTHKHERKLIRSCKGTTYARHRWSKAFPGKPEGTTKFEKWGLPISFDRAPGNWGWNPGGGRRRVGAVAPAAGRKREDNPHSLQPCVSGHGGIGGRRSSGRGKVQAAIHWAVSKNISFLTNEALLLKLPTMNQADTWDYVLCFPWAKV